MTAPAGRRSGSAVRVGATITALAAGHDVTVVLVTGPDGPSPAELDDVAAWCAHSGVDLVVVPQPPAPRWPLWRAMRLWLRSHATHPLGNGPQVPDAVGRAVSGADVVWVFQIYPYVAGAVPAHSCTVVDIDDVKERLDPHGLPWWAVGRRLHRAGTSRLRAAVLASARVVTVASPGDGDWLDPGADVRILPNTAPDPVPPAVADRQPAGDQVVLVGRLTYRPNAEAVAWFTTQVWPAVRAAIPAATFVVAGAGAGAVPALAGPPDGIVVAGEVADVGQVLAGAAVVVAPARSATGTSVKIVEAFAWGLPVVATTAAAAGLDVVAGRDLVVADDPAAFAACVVDLLGDPDRAGAIGAAGRAVYERHHAPTAFAAVVTGVVNDAVGPVAGAGGGGR
jgi:glycosyltransferase involved in cell wall biosynthesis